MLTNKLSNIKVLDVPSLSAFGTKHEVSFLRFLCGFFIRGVMSSLAARVKMNMVLKKKCLCALLINFDVFKTYHRCHCLSYFLKE